MGTPYKMKGSPMERNFGIGSPLHQDKMKASQTKTNKTTGKTTVNNNPGSKKKGSITLPTPNIVPNKTIEFPGPTTLGGEVEKFFGNVKAPKGSTIYTNPIITEKEKGRKKSFTPANK